ncbi:hypothetical protein A11S_1147 [Micavibrio aeruginosavorus EPB]|uniref:Uncharacterized protein n=1 Tax=Micavibrio aeruginosavorus EPB TaxID=349215 RepID=M4VIU0_9BACT|nr:hypothetical protein A11S_1147 [Micavibrio aeruginosavorus EPB]
MLTLAKVIKRPAVHMCHGTKQRPNARSRLRARAFFIMVLFT